MLRKFISVLRRNLCLQPLLNQDITGMSGEAARDKPQTGTEPGRARRFDL
jgi:hypothetical protein